MIGYPPDVPDEWWARWRAAQPPRTDVRDTPANHEAHLAEIRAAKKADGELLERLMEADNQWDPKRYRDR